MRRILKHALAESDLIGIWQYSFEQWNAVQADKYLDDLDSIRQLADSPEMGAERDYVREGYRVLFINSHAVYYTVTPSTIHIVRVLHGRMDLGSMAKYGVNVEIMPGVGHFLMMDDAEAFNELLLSTLAPSGSSAAQQ
jgi:toxin ParE1/3/4